MWSTTIKLTEADNGWLVEFLHEYLMRTGEMDKDLKDLKPVSTITVHKSRTEAMKHINSSVDSAYKSEDDVLEELTRLEEMNRP